MRSLVILVGVIVLLGGCAPDDQVFDISALSERHQRIFAEAAADLNERYPRRAQFEIGDGISFAVYGNRPAGVGATTFPPFSTSIRQRGYLIEFDADESSTDSDADLFQTSSHELCHVLGFGHDEGNPQGGSC